jgi:SEC-C motif
MERNELCWCGSGKKYKRCHMAMEEKMEQLREAGHIVPGRELLKTPAQIEAIKKVPN